MELIFAHFPDLSEQQKEQFTALKPLYEDWNSKINVISRKDMDHFYLKHVMHSLSICTLQEIKAGMQVLDVGTGGGFPGIPLAIYYPNTQFVLVDSIGKKIKVVQAVADALGLSNVTAIQKRMEELDVSADRIVSRAVAPAAKLIGFTRHLLNKGGKHIFIKGGDLSQEERDVKAQFGPADWEAFELKDWLKDPFYETKKLVVYQSLG